MAYVDPSLVISPKGKVSIIKILVDKGEDEWSLAEIIWEGEQRLGVRWNGGSGNSNFPGIGSPQSRGVPTWFVLPEVVGRVLRKNLSNF